MKKYVVIFYFFICITIAYSQLAGEIPLNTAQATFLGENAGDKAGYHMAIAGDVNNDGFDDILIAAPFFDTDTLLENNGKVYLIYGRAGGWHQNITLATADASFLGEAPNNQASHDVFGIGDVNGDNIDDFGIGVKFMNEAAVRAGKVYIFFGRPQGWNKDTSLAKADVMLLGEGATSEAAHIYGLGDVNGDGLGDLAVGAGFNDQAGDNAGKTFIVFGRLTENWSQKMNLSEADASYLGEMAGDWAGHRIAGVGDVNDDDLNDILIGASSRDQLDVADRGICYLILGKRTGWGRNVSLSNADASFLGPELKGANLGWTLCGPGDINGDHIDDMLLGAAGRSTVFVLFGKTTPWQRNLLIEQEADVVLNNGDVRDTAGADMRTAGDINGDGYNDFLIGAYGNDQVASNAGKAYLLYGRSNWLDELLFSNSDAIFLGENAEDLAGFAVAGGGDVDGNGTEDILISAPENDQNGENTGKVYLFFPTVKAFTLTSPGGTETWEVGATYTISWLSKIPQGNVRIELSRDGGLTWELLKDAPDNGSIQWKATGPASLKCLIRATQLATAQSDASHAYFSIIQSGLTVTSPNGGELWQYGEYHDITWTSSGMIPFVKIELSTDGGTSWTVIDNSAANDGHYSLLIPLLNSTQCLVRIADAADGSPWDVSNAVFRVTDGSGPSLIVLQPNGGELWAQGSSQTIRWSSQEITANVKIEFSIDGGANWQLIANNRRNIGVYEWLVPQTTSTQCLVRVRTMSNVYADISDHFFTILKSDIPVLHIEAEHLALDANLVKQARQDAGNDTIIALPQGNFSSTAYFKFDDRPDGDYELWIRYLDEADGSGKSSLKINGRVIDNWTWNAAIMQEMWVKRKVGTFHFSRRDKLLLYLQMDRGEHMRTDYIEFVPAGLPSEQNLKVLSPNGADHWMEGNHMDIAWESINSSGRIKIELSRDNGMNWETLAANEADDGLFTWTVTPPGSDNCLVRISDVDGFPFDKSDNVFQISEIPEIIVTRPAGGEDWRAETVQQITWQSTNTSGSVRIEVSRNNGITWQTIVENTADDGMYDWTVSGPQSNLCLIRITDSDGTPAGLCNTVFTISMTPAIIVLAPQGGENWAIDSQQMIQWASTNTSGQVDIELSRDNGSSWTLLRDNITDNGQRSWKVAGPPSTQCLIRVTDADGAPIGISAAVFSISRVPTITVTVPNGNELWYEDTQQNITWNAANTSGNVRVDVSRDNGATWLNLVGSTPDDGSFSWTVVGPSSDLCLVRVSDVAGGAVDQSDAAFKIAFHPLIAVVAPNGGERWRMGQQQQIRWTSTNSSGQVRIELSRDNGTSWQDIAAAISDGGAFAWTVIGPVSAQCLIRITDASGFGQDVSNEVFEIAPALSFTIIAPNGGERWQIGSTHDIVWASADGQNVNIYSSRDSGTTWDFLATTADVGQYSWQVTGPATQQAIIMVSTIDGIIFDESDQPFSILEPPIITVVTPNGGENWFIGTQQALQWTSLNTSGNVDISLSLDAGATWMPLAVNTPDDGAFTWTVTGSASLNCLVKVSDVDGTIEDISNTIFRISERPTIAILTPNGGEDWQIASQQEIRWQSTNTSDQISIYLSRNNGANWEQLATDIVNSGTFAWLVSAPSSPSCLIQVIDNVTGATDRCDAVFTISDIPAITITSPNGGEKLEIGKNYDISWLFVNCGPKVKIQLSKNNGGTWETLADNAVNSGSFTWRVHEPKSDQCLVRITDPTSMAADVSDAVFKIEYGTGVLSRQDFPTEFRLLQNYPNPFNPETRITFQCPKRVEVSVTIYNIMGERVRILVNGNLESGTHSITWDGRDDAGRLMPSGIYFYTFATVNYKQTNRMLFMK